MSRLEGHQIRLGLAALALAAGAVLVLQALLTLSNDLHRLERKAGDLAILKNIAADWSANQRALQPFEALTAKRPIPLTELAAQTLPGVTPSIRMRESAPALAGWLMRRTEVKCEATPAALGNFLLAAESARPPWRLVEFDFTLAATAPDAIRATLVLEALEKK